MPDHPHCHSTAHDFSLYTGRDIDSDDSYARPLIHACAQPIVWFVCERKLRAGHRAETRQNGSGAPLSSFPLLLVVVLAEHGGCLSSVDRDRELRIWNEREVRRHECETRCWLTLERVRNSLLESFQSRRLSLVAGRDAKVRNWTDPLILNPWLWRANRVNHNGRRSASFAATDHFFSFFFDFSFC